MGDKAIYSVDTVETITDNDKIYVNTGDNIKQIKRSDLFIDINSNLVELEYSDIAGGKNLLDLPNPYSITGTYAEYIVVKVKKNTNYTLSVGSATSSVYQGIIVRPINSDTNIIEKYSAPYIMRFNSGDNESIRLFFYSGNATSGTSVYSDVQLEYGTTATPYEPYIPSVKMLAEEVSAQNESLADYGMDNKCSNLVNGYYNADNGSLITNYNPLRYICSTNSYYLKKGETIRVNGNSVDSIYLSTYDTNGSFINRKDYYDKKDVTYIAQDNIIIKWSVSFPTDTPINQSPHIGVYVNNAIADLKNDLGSKVNFDRILGVNIPCEADQWTVLDNSLNWFQLNVIPILKTAYQASSGNQAGGLLRINANTGGIEFKADAYCDYVFVYLLKI